MVGKLSNMASLTESRLILCYPARGNVVEAASAERLEAGRRAVPRRRFSNAWRIGSGCCQLEGSSEDDMRESAARYD